MARVFRFRGHEWPLGEKTYLLAIMNVTPDSFSDGAADNSDPQYQVEKAARLIEDGADGLDLGAESTRPGYAAVSLEEEWARLGPVLRMLRLKYPQVPLSVDTQKALVARRALDEGCDIINDVWGLAGDEAMASTVGATDGGLILMYNSADPPQQFIRPFELREFFERQSAWARRCGIDTSSILIDPGIGFRVRGESSWEMLTHLEAIRGIGAGVLVGHSRKAFLGAVTGVKEPGQRDVATAMLSGLLSLSGVDVLRVHNPELTRQALNISQMWKDAQHGNH